MTIHFSTSYKWNAGERTEDQNELPATGRNDLERQLAGIRKEVNVMQVNIQGFDSNRYLLGSPLKCNKLHGLSGSSKLNLHIAEPI